MNDFEIGTVRVGPPSLFLIAGPCVIESETHARFMADAIQRITSDLGLPYIFKASYDKANRTSAAGFRGPGLAQGVGILRRIAETTGLPVITDVHEAGDCEAVAEAVDVLQIPAFLCRQTDLLLAAAKTGRAVNIKKGQFVAPWDMRYAADKVSGAGNPRVLLTERGFCFGYNNLVVDMRSLAIMRRIAPVIFDGTHSVQTPSSAGGQSGGQPRVGWEAVVRDRTSHEVHSVMGHVEIRWSHGRFGGLPEAKGYLDTPHHLVPGYFALR